MEAGTNSLVSQSDKAGSKKLDSNLISDLLNYSPRQLIFCPAANAIIFCDSFFFLPPSLTFAWFNYFHRPAFSSRLWRNEALQGFLVVRFYSCVLCLVQLFAVILHAKTLCKILSFFKSFIMCLTRMMAFINTVLHTGACAQTHTRGYTRQDKQRLVG